MLRSQLIPISLSLFSNVISLLGRHKADPNTIIPKLNIAPIHYAVGFENCEFAEKITSILLENGADTNLAGEDGLTPLHIACIWVSVRLNNN